MERLWLGLDEYLSSSSSPLSTSSISPIPSLVPLEPIIERELKALAPLAPRTTHVRPPLPKLESYPENVVDILSTQIVHTSMPSVLDDPIWKSKRQVSQELGVYTGISKPKSSNGVQVGRDTQSHRRASRETFDGIVLSSRIQRFTTPVVDEDPHHEVPRTPTTFSNHGGDDPGENSGSILKKQTDALCVGTQTVIYRCPVAGHPQDPTSNNVIEHMLENNCRGGMVMETVMTTVVCVDCKMHIPSQDALFAHLNDCKLSLARKRSETGRDAEVIVASTPKRQPSPLQAQLSSLESDEGADGGRLVDARFADPPTGPDLDENLSGVVTHSSSSLSSLSRLSSPNSPNPGSFGPIVPTKPRPLQQLTAINFASLSVLTASGPSNMSDSSVDDISHHSSKDKLAATSASRRPSHEHVDDNDSEDSEIICASLEVGRVASSSPSTGSPPLSAPTLAEGRSSSHSKSFNSIERWECSKCALDARYKSKELVEFHIEKERCGGKPTMPLEPPSNQCQTCSATFFTPSELDMHACPDGVTIAFDTTATPMTASASASGSQAKARKTQRDKPRPSVSNIREDDTQPSPSQEDWSITDISRTLFELFACNKCAVLKDHDNSEYKYPAPSGVKRHASFRRCNGEATKAFCRPFNVCDRCRRPWFSRKAWLDHCAKGCAGLPVSRPRVSSPQGSVSSRKAIIDDSDGESSAKPQPSSNRSTNYSIFDDDNSAETRYSITGRPIRKAGLKVQERISSITSLLNQIPEPNLSTSKLVSQKRSSPDGVAGPSKRQKHDVKSDAESNAEVLARWKGKGKPVSPKDVNRLLTLLVQPEKLKTTPPSSKRAHDDEDDGELDGPILKRIRTSETALDDHDEALVTRIQTKRCQTHFPAVPQQCVCCRRRKPGDVCRFIGIREFTLRDEVVVGRRFVSNLSDTVLDLPGEWNTIPTPAQITTIKCAVANTLRDPLRQELAHLRQSDVIRRPQEVEVRATCDTCMTSIFAGCWMCSCCGREICGDCYASLATYDYLEPKVGRAVLKRLNVTGYHTEEELTCVRRLLCEFAYAHFKSGFIPVSRFDAPRLSNVITAMDDLTGMESHGPGSPDHESLRAGVSSHPFITVDYLPTPSSPSDASKIPMLNNSVIVENFLTSGLNPAIPVYPGGAMITPDDPSGVLSLPLLVFAHDDLAEDVFRNVWANGEPLVVTGLLHRFGITWNPEYFIKTYGDEDCRIVECQSEVETDSTVKTFFEQFGKYDGRDGRLKLKDWPPTEDFKTSFPELFADFSQAVPIPNYTRRDGALNIASHFPTNAVAPDLGPKMYNAFESFEGPGGKGSTRLHMDMADAVNVMNYAAPRKDGSPGYAAWNIFRASDASAIRDFLVAHFPGASEGLDPIHSQVHFLDTALREQLFAEKGVRSWRIDQKPGEAVFIPAGCAHQVCNMADCIKVAVDFVSPENVRRCETLTREFREQNQTQAWKEDVLQLRTMMWYAWLSCERLEQLRASETQEPPTCSESVQQHV